MSRAFADIVFTPAVLKEQEKRGGAGRYNEQYMAPDERRVDTIGPEQAELFYSPPSLGPVDQLESAGDQLRPARDNLPVLLGGAADAAEAPATGP